MDIETKENRPEERLNEGGGDERALTETRKRAHSDDESDGKKSKIDLVELADDSDPPESPSIVEVDEEETSAPVTPSGLPRRACTAHPPHSAKTPTGLKASKALREMERLKKTEEKQRAKEERERQLELRRQEKERKEKEKEEKRREEELKREEKRKEEEKKKEEKRKEEEERKRKKEEERELKKREEEEKRKKKDEEREKKRKEEEEKLARKREEEQRKEAKRREEEAAKAAEEEKKRRMSNKFKSFFTLEKKPTEKPVEKEKETWFRPFNLKEGATLAPILHRSPLPFDWQLETLPDDLPSTYLDSIKHSRKLVLASRIDPMKAKLFHFHTNYRPPYYGTWRKRPGSGVSGKTPFGKMSDLDYENDSDSEWEEEPEDADECRSDEEEELEKDEEDEDDDDEGFFVDPAYLSDGEGDVGEEGDERAAQGKETAEVRAERLAKRAKVWEQSVNRKKQLLVATILGPNYKNPPVPCELLQVVIF